MNRRDFVLGLIAGISAFAAGAYATSPVPILKGAKAIAVFARVISADVALLRLMASEEIEQAVIADLTKKVAQAGKDILVGDRNFSSTLPADFVWPAVVFATIRVDLAWSSDPTAGKILGAVTIIFERDREIFPSPVSATLFSATTATLREASLAAARAQANASIINLLL
jgi:hypothetical protein